MKRFFMIVGAIVVALIGLNLLVYSFEELQDARRISRIPLSKTSGVLTGETYVKGRATAAPGTPLLTSPDTKTSCLYYFYHVEREEKDSDGDTRWVTVSASHELSDFLLNDDTGALRIEPHERDLFQIGLSHRRRSGKLRFSEYRIDPGDHLVVMGMVRPDATGQPVLRFDSAGSYVPMISDGDQRQETQSRARASAASTGAAMVLLMLATWMLLGAFRIHNTTLFLLLFSLGSTATLTWMGIEFAQRDVEELGDRLERLDQALTEELGALTATGAASDWRVGLNAGALSNPDALERARRIRIAGAQVIEAAQRDLRRFPELLFADTVSERLLESPTLSPEEEAMRTPLESPASLPGVWGWILVAVLLASMLASTRGGLRAVRLKRLMEHMPTTKIRGVTYGLTEIVGRSSIPETTQPLVGPVSDKPCVYYNYVVTRKSGDKTVTEKNITEHIPFVLDDESASIVVHPAGAAFYTDHHVSRSEGSRTYNEYAIYLDETLYALGPAGLSEEVHDRLQLLEADDLPFVIASIKERELHYRVGRKGNFLLGLGVALTASLGMYAFTSFGTFGAGDYVYATVTSCIYTLGCFLALMFNDLVFVRQRVARAYANIEVTLKKRFDLIASLLPVVSSYVAHERETLEAIAALRAHAPADAPSAEAMSQTTTSLAASNQASTALFALREAYPNLQADTHVLTLMRTLTDVEDELALMRSGFNDTVEHYNTRISKLPELLIAGAFGFRPAMHLDATVARNSPAPDMRGLQPESATAPSP